MARNKKRLCVRKPHQKSTFTLRFMFDPRADYEAQRAQIENELKELAPEPLATQLGAMIRPAITLETSPSSGELAPLVSKFGGAPDVPVGFEWPHFKGAPLSFVA